MKYYIVISTASDGSAPGVPSPYNFMVEASSPLDAMNLVDALNAGRRIYSEYRAPAKLAELNTKPRRGVDYIDLREWVK